jgi:DNA-binding MarR family transcriptional regulator
MAVDWLRENEPSVKKLSASAYKILKILEQKGNVSASELTSELNVSTRTVHYALKTLMEKNIIDRKPYLFDMRQTRYTLHKTLVKKIVNENFILQKNPFQGQLR